MTTRFHILHTNDFHNHLDTKRAAVIERTRTELGPCLLLDSGDAISAGNVGVRPGGEPILDLMSDLNYAAMTLGNREFHVADALLRVKINRARFPVLCANMRWREDRGDDLPVSPHVITKVGDIRVGILGLTVPMVTPQMTARVISAYVFDDPVITARREIALLRPQVDVLIALTHIGVREDERLASTCPELDAVLGGHSHVVLHAPQIVAGVPIFQGGWYGHHLGIISVEILQPGSRPTITGRLVALRE